MCRVFRETITGINKKLGPGIDTRCFGGYVLPPPSYVNRRRYELLDSSLPLRLAPIVSRSSTE